MKTKDYEIVFSWENQSSQYPIKGEGIQYFRPNDWVECLLYYDDNKELSGILNYYPSDIPHQRGGSVNIQIRPDKRRKGIATKLLDTAMKRFSINLYDQDYTALGEKFIRKYLPK